MRLQSFFLFLSLVGLSHGQTPSGETAGSGVGLRGIYSVEQWSGKYQDIDYEKVGDWLIEHVQKNI